MVILNKLTSLQIKLAKEFYTLILFIWSVYLAHILSLLTQTKDTNDSLIDTNTIMINSICDKLNSFLQLQFATPFVWQ